MVYRLDTPGVEDQAITNEKIKVNAVSDTKIDNTISNALVPIGGIIMWSGAQGDLPANWKICDGTVYGSGASQVVTPNLVDKFVIAGGTYDAVDELWKTSIEGTAESEGGTKDLVVPAHTHSITDTGHTHNLNYQQKQVEDTGSAYITDIRRQGGDGDGTTTDYTDDNTSGFMENANTGITATDEEGEVATNKNLPPYFAIAYIMRIS